MLQRFLHLKFRSEKAITFPRLYRKILREINIEPTDLRADIFQISRKNNASRRGIKIFRNIGASRSGIRPYAALFLFADRFCLRR